MKNRLFKILLTTLCLCAVLCVLAGCDQLGSIIGGLPGGGCQHEYGDWELFSDGECQTRVYKHVCSKCQNLEWKEGTDADHVWEDRTVEPTCTTEGSLLSVCSVCEKSEVKESLPIVDHVWEETIVDPTCIADGAVINVCTVCEESKTETIPPLTGHTYTLQNDSDYHWQYCEICDVRTNTESHNYGSNNMCSVCEHKKPAEKQVIKIWVSEITGATELTKRQIEKFLEANPEYAELYTFEIDGVMEADAATLVLADVALAPDIFCFAQDMLPRLVQAAAIARPTGQIANNVALSNDEISIKAASVGGTIYAYPMTSDNGYYMYYDKSVITNPDSLEQIIADCEAAGKKICFQLSNGWYNASFFMATGCHSNWIVNEYGKFTSVDDNYNSEAGLIAMKGMQKLTKSTAYRDSSYDFINAAVMITGVWYDAAIKEILGDNYAATDLPSFTVDGKTYHLGSYSGNKLMGVKPQTDPAKAAFLSKLAEYLTGAECQLERYNEFSWGPSNLEAQDSDEMKNNAALSALNLQSKYAVPQGNINGNWWDIAAYLGLECQCAESESDLRNILDEYSRRLDALFSKGDEELYVWSVIGSICGTAWDTDFTLTEVYEGVFESDVFELHVGEEFKVRWGYSWDVNFGADGQRNGINFVVQTEGKYIIRFTLHSDTYATIQLVSPDATDENCEHVYGNWKPDPRVLLGMGYCNEVDFARTCTKCGQVETRPGTEEDHVYTERTNKVDCTKGNVYNVCNICNKYVFLREIAMDHDYSRKMDATQHWMECSDCGEMKDAEDHTLGSNGACTICEYKDHDLMEYVGTYDITMWVSDVDGTAEFTRKQIEAFMAKYPGIVINATINGVSEWDAASMAMTDVASAADIYCFPQDALHRLVQAGALATPTGAQLDSILNNNDPSSILASSVNGTTYAFPFTSDNGFYMYYDKSIITNPDDLHKIVDDCEAAEKKIHFELSNGWYNASFFFATGCHSNWTVDENGKFIAVDDTYNSPEGLIAMRGMQIVTHSPSYVNASYPSPDAAVLISGIWNDGEMREILGDNYAVTDLPSFTIDGNSYHLGSFSGHKLMGVKPQNDSKREKLLSILAEYLTGAECQLDRYEEFGWAPSNLEAKESDSVKADDAIAALNLQSEWAIPMGEIYGYWWEIAARLGDESQYATSDSELQEALERYSDSVEALLMRDEEELYAWSVIGSICGTAWDTDFRLTQVSDNVFESAVFDLRAGEEFKIRQGGSWDVHFSADGLRNGPNCVVDADGTYVIRFTLHSAESATIELIPQ